MNILNEKFNNINFNNKLEAKDNYSNKDYSPKS
jgi:hypothetical protein